MLAALLLPRVLDRIAERSVMLAGGAPRAVGMAAGMLMPSFAGLLAIWVLIGVGSSLVQTRGSRLLRRSSHEEDRPALFATQFALSHACWLLTYLVAGVVGNAIGLSWTFGLLGLIVVASGVLAARLWPAVDPEVLEHEHAFLHHRHLHVHDEHHRHEHEGSEGPEPHWHPHAHAPRAIVTTTSSICIISTGRHEVIVPAWSEAPKAHPHPVGQRTTPVARAVTACRPAASSVPDRANAPGRSCCRWSRFSRRNAEGRG